MAFSGGKFPGLVLYLIQTSDLTDKPDRIGKVLLQGGIKPSSRMRETAYAFDARLFPFKRLIDFIGVSLDRTREVLDPLLYHF